LEAAISANSCDVLRHWFADNRRSGLILPDGWFGRPFDNVYELTSVEEDGSVLEFVLEGQLLLRFEGLRAIDRVGERLLLGPFDHLFFEAKITPPVKRVYSAGKVELVAGL